MSQLEEYRRQIDQIDRDLAALFLNRLEVTEEVGANKQK